MSTQPHDVFMPKNFCFNSIITSKANDIGCWYDLLLVSYSFWNWSSKFPIYINIAFPTFNFDLKLIPFNIESKSSMHLFEHVIQTFVQRYN